MKIIRLQHVRSLKTINSFLQLKKKVKKLKAIFESKRAKFSGQYATLQSGSIGTSRDTAEICLPRTKATGAINW